LDALSKSGFTGERERIGDLTGGIVGLRHQLDQNERAVDGLLSRQAIRCVYELDILRMQIEATALGQPIVAAVPDFAGARPSAPTR
jgi:hypothetical protein